MGKGEKMRSYVKDFAEAMEAKLQTKDDERGPNGWMDDDCSVKFLHDALTRELTEARHDMNDCNPIGLAGECVDIANFAMMIRSRILSGRNKP